MKRSPQERLALILDRLNAGSVSVQELVREMGVSEISIRRDLAVLKREGKLLRVYGGAVPHARMAYEFSFKEKEARHREAKERIGRIAALSIEPDSAVFVDTGTTALAVARALREARPRLIVTVNLCVASEYVGQDTIRVLVAGGEVGARSPDVYGEWTMETLSNVTVDVAFLGCDALDAEGFYTADTRSAAISRLMLKRAARRVLIADSSKFGRRALCRIAPLSAVHAVATETRPPAPLSRALARAGVGVLTEVQERKNAHE